MSREIVEDLIARKAALTAEQFQIEKELAAIPPEHRWVTTQDIENALTPEQANVRETFLALNSRRLMVQEQLDRAHRFGLHHTKSLVPTLCLDCFVYQDLSSRMVEVESRLGNGIRTFKCGKPCGYELSVDESIPQPGSV